MNTIVAVVLMLGGYSNASAAETLATTFNGGFESVVYQYPNAVNNWLAPQPSPPGDRLVRVSSPVRKGSYSLKVTVKSGDNYGSSGERAEVFGMYGPDGKQIFENEASGTQFYTISVYLPLDFKSPSSSWGSFQQLHSNDIYNSYPSFAIGALDTYYVQMISGDLNALNDPKKSHTVKYPIGALQRGKWVDFVWKIKFAKTFTGTVDVWRRIEGETSFTQVLSIANIPTLSFNSTVSGGAVLDAYWKTGYYTSAETFTRVIYIDSNTRGASFNDVVAAAFPTSSAETAVTDIDVTIAGTSQGSYPMNPGTSQVVKYALDGGPVVISSNNGVGIIASLNQWRRPTPTGGWTGVAQSMALPVSQISNSYVIPRYNGTDPTLYNAVLMANVDTVPRTITVKIGGTVMGSYLLGPSDSRFEVYDIVGGPLVVSSVAGSKIVASLYELKRAGASGEYNGQSEMMGLPSTQLSDRYLIPIYFGMWPGYLDASLAFANVDTVSTTVEVKIAGVSQGTYNMPPSTSMVVKYALDGGPVEISSNNGAKIVASLIQWRRPTPSGGWTGVAQSMALPLEKISNSYVMPRYNGTDPSLYNAVLMANVDSVPRTITVKIGGTVMGSYLLEPSDSRFEVYNVVGGPLVVSSDVGSKIVASLYELKRAGGTGEYNSQSEMMGLTTSLLSDKYLIPIYFGMWGNYLDASLYIGVP